MGTPLPWPSQQAAAGLAVVRSSVGILLRLLLVILGTELVVGELVWRLGVVPRRYAVVIYTLTVALVALPWLYWIVSKKVAILVAEQAAAASGERFQFIAHSMHDGIIIYGRNGRIQFVSRAAAGTFGYSVEELHGANVEILMPEHARKRFKEDLEEYLTTSASLVFGAGQIEAEGLRKNGEVVPIELAVDTLQEEGEIRFVAILRNISRRKEEERSLQERTERLDALIENSPLAIVVTDAAGLVQMSNPAFERLFGYKSAEIAGQRLDDLVTNDAKRAEAYEYTERLLRRQSLHAVGQRRRKDDTLMDVEIHAVPLVVAGNLVGAYSIYQDLSERKRLQIYEQILPVCCVCGKIRDDTGLGRGKGTWEKLDQYVARHTDAQFSHTFCPECIEEYKKQNPPPGSPGQE